jgi:hypothetical protein
VLWRQNAAAVLTIAFSFERVLTPRPDRLFEEQRKPSGVCLAFGHSWCDKRVIGEPLNLIHNVAPKGQKLAGYVTLSRRVGSIRLERIIQGSNARASRDKTKVPWQRADDQQGVILEPGCGANANTQIRRQLQPIPRQKLSGTRLLIGRFRRRGANVQ